VTREASSKKREHAKSHNVIGYRRRSERSSETLWFICHVGKYQGSTSATVRGNRDNDRLQRPCLVSSSRLVPPRPHGLRPARKRYRISYVYLGMRTVPRVTLYVGHARRIRSRSRRIGLCVSHYACVPQHDRRRIYEEAGTDLHR
jgi:hypothetical protein